MKNRFKSDVLDGMKSAIIKSIQNDSPDELSGLLVENDEFWGKGPFYDDFMIDRCGDHLLGTCLEHDAQNCAKYLINANLERHDLNTTGPDGSGIEPAISKALACRSNEVVAMLLENPDVEVNEEFDGITPLERALINHNYDGAKMLIKGRNVLDSGPPFDLTYHQVKATELSVWDDSRPIEFIINQSPDNVILPSAVLTAIYSDASGADGLVDRFFKMNLDKDVMFDAVCSLSDMWMEDKQALSVLSKCLESGADASYNNYEGIIKLAKSNQTNLINSLGEYGFDINEDDGAVLKAAINNLDCAAFKALVEAGGNPDLLESRVASYVTNPEKITGEQLSEISRMQETVDSFCNKPTSTPSVMVP